MDGIVLMLVIFKKAMFQEIILSKVSLPNYAFGQISVLLVKRKVNSDIKMKRMKSKMSTCVEISSR